MSSSAVLRMIEAENASHQVVIYSKSYCPYCEETKVLFNAMPNIEVVVHELDTNMNGMIVQEVLQKMTGQGTVPNVFVNGVHVGGSSHVHEAFREGKLAKLLSSQVRGARKVSDQPERQRKPRPWGRFFGPRGRRFSC